MKPIQKLFLIWMLYASLSFFVQYYEPESNMGLLFAVLILPLFMHDILLLLREEVRKIEK